MALAFSFILPAYNEAAHIGRCLQALRRSGQGFTVQDVIVVDNGSTDRTCDIARDLDARVIVGEPGRRRTIASLRNAGAAQASGDIFVFLDADMLVPPHFLAAAAARYEAGFTGILGYVDKAPDDAGLVARAFGDRLYRKRGVVMAVDYLPGRNLFVPATLFARLGGFDATLVTAEDKDFTLRAVALGEAVLSSPEAPVIHLGCERNLLEFIRKEYWRQGRTLALLRKDGLTLRGLRNPALSAFHLLAPLAALALWGLGHSLAALIALMLWLAPAVGLAAREVGPRDRLYPATAGLVFLRWIVSGVALCRQLLDLCRRPTVPAPGDLAVEVLAGFDAPGLAEAWDELLPESADDSLFVTREWLGSWWRVYGQGRPLLLLAVRDGQGRLIALAPLYAAPWRMPPGVPLRAVRLVGDDFVGSDFLALPARRGREDAAMGAVLEYLLAHVAFDVLAVLAGPADSPGLAALARQAKLRGLAVGRGRPMPCPYLALPDSLEAFHALPDRTFKSIVRKTHAHLGKRHGAVYRFETPPGELDAWLERFFAANADRWQAAGQPGAFASPEKRRFYKEIAREAQARGWDCLAEAAIGGKPAAMEFGLLRRGVLYNLQMAATAQGRKLRAGNALRYALLSRLIGLGTREFNMLRGDEAYKYQWGGLDRFTADLLVWRGWRGRLAGLVHAGWAGLKRLRRALRRPG